VEKPMDATYRMFVGGDWVDGCEGKTFETTCPANGEHLATCVDAGAEDVDRAVQAAWKAFDGWKKTSPPERQRMLLKLADLMEANLDKLAMIETLDNGKPIRETRTSDIPGSIDLFRYFASAVRTDEGEATMINPNMLSIVLHEPIGVVGQIVAWNYPLFLAAGKLAPALAAGDCVVIKPSSVTPLSLLEFAKLAGQVLPPGVLNVVTGVGSRAGNHLLQHPRLRKLSFTGSTEVGYAVAEAAARKLIPSTLELGGKSANIYFPDCPWDKAIEGVQIGILASQGQVCTSGSRVFVHEDIYDRFLGAAVAGFEKVKVGLPWDMATQMGSLVNEAQLQKVLGYIELGKKEGARVATGGYRLTADGLDQGCFMAPTILTGVDNKMRVAQEEIFGPVACFIKFRTEEEVIEMANDSEYGLAGAVWTKDINRAFRVAQSVETGRMWVNCYIASPAHMPFGGYKKSGIGREGHKIALEHYTQKKSICISLSEARTGRY